jgi:hypothetical protein
MSGIVAAAQSSGCCCRPVEGCTCNNANRPGAVFDRSLTSLVVSAELDLRQRYRENSCQGCVPCGCCSGQQIPNGGQYVYVQSGSIMDPDFAEECPDLFCRSACGPYCPEYGVSANFGSRVLEKRFSHPLFGEAWGTVVRSALDNIAGTWNWTPRQVGYCIDPNTGYRVRRFCRFYGLVATSDSITGVDPNGQYVDANNNYTGRNVGLCSVYATASVTTPSHTASSFGQLCGYKASIFLEQHFRVPYGDFIQSEGGVLFTGGGGADISAQYYKPCLSPSDTVIGTYYRLEDLSYRTYATDQTCGDVAYVEEYDITFPETITVS